jgi:hypothetical protein
VDFCLVTRKSVQVEWWGPGLTNLIAAVSSCSVCARSGLDKFLCYLRTGSTTACLQTCPMLSSAVHITLRNHCHYKINTCTQFNNKHLHYTTCWYLVTGFVIPPAFFSWLECRLLQCWFLILVRVSLTESVVTVDSWQCRLVQRCG